MSEETVNTLLKTCRILLDIAKKHTNQIKALEQTNPSLKGLEAQITELTKRVDALSKTKEGGSVEKELETTLEETSGEG